MRTIRRSGARDLPPDADHVGSQVTVATTAPRAGTLLSISSPCGVALRVRVKEAEMLGQDWIGWADVLPGSEKDLQRAGVPVGGEDVPMRIFSWQVQTDKNM